MQRRYYRNPHGRPGRRENASQAALTQHVTAWLEQQTVRTVNGYVIRRTPQARGSGFLVVGAGLLPFPTLEAAIDGAGLLPARGD